MKHVKWPEGKKFAFTIVDDTDEAFLNNIKPVYDYLMSKGIKTTKTIWVFKSRNHYHGDYISNNNKEYLNYLINLQKNGFEIAFHNAGSGSFVREETIDALEIFRRTFGVYPTLHINHANNSDNLYWGYERFRGPVKLLYRFNRKTSVPSYGSNPSSKYFWGDYSKQFIKYIRNRTFNTLNTMKIDKQIVRKEIGKTDYSNYWFSSSEAMNLKNFKKIVTKKHINKLEKQNGCCILYTHFAYGFVNEKGELNDYFKNIIDYLSQKDGWFVPCSTLLDYLTTDKKESVSKNSTLVLLDLKWLFHRMIKKLFFRS